MTAEDRDIPPNPTSSTAQQIVEMLSTPEDIAGYVAAMRRGIKTNQRWAVRQYAEMHKLVGAQQQIAMIVFQQLGASSEDEARRAVALYREANGWDARTKIEEMARTIIKFVQAQPELLPVALAALRGITSGAEEIE